MSASNGAKARFHLQRLARINRRTRTREMAKAMAEEKALKAKSAPVARPAAN